MSRVSVRGGSFLLGPTDPVEVSIPEELTAEERQIGELAKEFVFREVLPNREAMERQEWDVARQLLRKAGELGLLGAEIPEAYGGLNLSKRASLTITQALTVDGSFGVTFGAHTGIGTLPIVYFGTVDQKRRYLPDLATGARVAAYSLTEPNAGSDALSARTVAVRQPDGSYLLRGQKQWTSNAGFADVFIVYARVDGEHFTAFIVERDWPGVSIGPEAKKMGLKGSSTAAVFLDNVPVPAENVLYDVGKGHRVAFNILNLGRFKLGAGCAGGCRNLVLVSANYALQRQQFGRPIAFFGLIRQKLAEMAVLTYAADSVAFRVAGLLDRALAGIDTSGDVRDEANEALAEFAIECSVAKVFGTEALHQVVDEAVQIHGGYGYMQEYEVERAYRDTRINRIFEGTNEINRLLILDTLFRRALRGQLPILPVLQGLKDELASYAVPEGWDDPLARALWQVETGKKLTLMGIGLAAQKHMQRLEEEQELLGLMADTIIDSFVAESAALRAQRLRQEQGPEAAAGAVDATVVFAEEAFGRIERKVRTLLAALGEEALREPLAALRRLTRIQPLDTVAVKRRIAQRVLEEAGRGF